MAWASVSNRLIVQARRLRSQRTTFTGRMPVLRFLEVSKCERVDAPTLFIYAAVILMRSHVNSRLCFASW